MSENIFFSLRNAWHPGDWNFGCEVNGKGMKMAETKSEIMIEIRLHGWTIWT